MIALMASEFAIYGVNVSSHAKYKSAILALRHCSPLNRSYVFIAENMIVPIMAPMNSDSMIAITARVQTTLSVSSIPFACLMRLSLGTVIAS